MDYISEIECKNVLKNFIKMGVSVICYLRNLFAESVFEDAKIGELHLKRLTRLVPESSSLIDWIDYGEYLRSLIVTIHDGSNAQVESYYVTLSPTPASEHSPATKEAIKESTVRSLRELILLIQSLSPLDDYCFLSIKLTYFDSVPDDYEPRFFASDSSGAGNLPFVQITTLDNGYSRAVIELFTTSNLNEASTNYLTKSTTKHNSALKNGPGRGRSSLERGCSGDGPDRSGGEDECEDPAILQLIERSESLCRRHRFINKSIVAAGLGIRAQVAKVLIKRLIERGSIDRKCLRNRGYT